MGYYMNQRDSNFYIKRKNVGAAHDALKCIGDVSWADSSVLKMSRSLAEAFDELRWRIEIDDDGNVDGIYFKGEKAGGDELVYFDAIAPYVKKGSFIEMAGEDGSMWRWVFNGKKCDEITPKIEW